MQIVTVGISTSVYGVSHTRGVMDMSRARASCCFQFPGFMDKTTTLPSVLGVALYVAFHVMVR